MLITFPRIKQNSKLTIIYDFCPKGGNLHNNFTSQDYRVNIIY